ncbi:MAG: penicillin-binding transpeptidase domain-containing protein [Patescibacteria group bacterium]
MFGPQLGKFKIKRPHHEIEFHEVLLDSLAQKKERELGLSEQKLEILLPQKILQALWLGFLILTLMLFGKTVQFQVFEGKALAQASENNRYVIRLIQAQRGVIYDKNMTQLVFNKPSFDLIVRPNDLPKDESAREKIFKNVAQIIGQDYETLSKKINISNFAEVAVAENLDYQTLILFEARSHEFPGFETKNNTVREYVPGLNVSHLIGYQRKTGEKKGLEEYYDDVLKANPGELQVKRDVFGNPIDKEVVVQPSPGQSLVLYLDAGLQKKLNEAMEAVLKSVGAKSGAAVALDPKTGGVLAMTSFPAYDNNLFSQGMSQDQWNEINSNSQHPLFNRVISGGYLVGSTIKPLLASAVLQEKIILPDKKINDNLGFISIPNPWDPSSPTIKKDWSIHGLTDMRKAIAESCDVYFYTIGGGFGTQEGLGPTKIKQYLELFGWGQETGIDLPEEAKGFIPDKAWKKQTWGQSWWDGDTYNLSIGQGFLQITPLEVANSFVAIANGGILYQPHIVKEIIDSNKNQVEEITPTIIRQNFIDPQNLAVAREGMRQAVTGVNSPQASAVLLSSLSVKVAAKTGTAELGGDYYQNWVTVFAPYDDPQIVLTIVVEKVKGAQVASLPVAQEVLDWYFSP